eukprot:PhM_4_TR3394/c1_g1_i1/m.18508
MSSLSCTVSSRRRSCSFMMVRVSVRLSTVPSRSRLRSTRLSLSAWSCATFAMRPCVVASRRTPSSDVSVAASAGPTVKWALSSSNSMACFSLTPRKNRYSASMAATALSRARSSSSRSVQRRTSASAARAFCCAMSCFVSSSEHLSFRDSISAPRRRRSSSTRCISLNSSSRSLSRVRNSSVWASSTCAMLRVCASCSWSTCEVSTSDSKVLMRSRISSSRAREFSTSTRRTSIRDCSLAISDSSCTWTPSSSPSLTSFHSSRRGRVVLCVLVTTTFLATVAKSRVPRVSSAFEASGLTFAMSAK